MLSVQKRLKEEEAEQGENLRSTFFDYETCRKSSSKVSFWRKFFICHKNTDQTNPVAAGEVFFTIIINFCSSRYRRDAYVLLSMFYYF